MPVNKRYPIAGMHFYPCMYVCIISILPNTVALLPVELLDACEYYVSKTNRRVSFEWALIQGQTDTDVTAHELGALLRGH